MLLIELLVNAVVLLLAAYILPKVEIRSFLTALWVAILIGIIGFLVGWLLRGILHVGTLGIPALLGLSFLIRLVANAIVIKIVDAMVGGFKVHGFTNALILAAIVALAGALLTRLFGDDDTTSLLIEQVKLLAYR